MHQKMHHAYLTGKNAFFDLGLFRWVGARASIYNKPGAFLGAIFQNGQNWKPQNLARGAFHECPKMHQLSHFVSWPRRCPLELKIQQQKGLEELSPFSTVPTPSEARKGPKTPIRTSPAAGNKISPSEINHPFRQSHFHPPITYHTPTGGPPLLSILPAKEKCTRNCSGLVV